MSGTDQWWPCFPTKSPGNLSPSVLAFLLYVEISQWLGSRGAKLKVGCWVSKIKGGLNGAGHLTLSDGVGLKAWKLYLIGGVTALLPAFRVYRAKVTMKGRTSSHSINWCRVYQSQYEKIHYFPFLSWGKSLSLLHFFLIKKKANSINEEIPR